MEPTCLCSLQLQQRRRQQTLFIVSPLTSFKLIGVYIDSTMSWTIHVDNIDKKSHSHVILSKAA